MPPRGQKWLLPHKKGGVSPPKGGRCPKRGVFTTRGGTPPKNSSLGGTPHTFLLVGALLTPGKTPPRRALRRGKTLPINPGCLKLLFYIILYSPPEQTSRLNTRTPRTRPRPHLYLPPQPAPVYRQAQHKHATPKHPAESSTMQLPIKPSQQCGSTPATSRPPRTPTADHDARKPAANHGSPALRTVT